MKIDFSDYRSLTEKDIIFIDNAGIECSIGKISFTECRDNFSEYHNIDGNYIGGFDYSGSVPSVCLYTAPRTTHFFFADNKIQVVINKVKEYGFEFIDINALP